MSKRREIVVFLCDRTGNAAKPWAEAGYECYCVDLQHSMRKPLTKGNIHFVYGDVRSWVPPDRSKIVFLGAFPPCTHVTGSGSTDWQVKGNFALIDTLELWTACYRAGCFSGAPFFIENPVGLLSHYMRKPDHIFHPSDYAGYLPKAQRETETYMKKTCLWVGNGFVMPPKRSIAPVESMFPLKKKKSTILSMSPSVDRADKRAETPVGFSIATFEYNHRRLP